MTKQLLTLDEVEVRYGNAVAVRDISFDVAPGEILGLVGESGSGKTTIGRAIAGFHEPTRGRITWRGEPLAARRSAGERREIQMVFQDPFLSLNPVLSVRSILSELLRSQDSARVPDRLDDLLRTVALDPALADARPRRLSGGERQRVAIARALAVQPQLIVADEPTSALDVSVQAAILNLFARLRDETGAALIVISHDIEVVEYLCDRVIVLRHGHIVEAGPAADVLHHPQADYTRELLNSVPRLPAAALWALDEQIDLDDHGLPTNDIYNEERHQ